MKTIFFALVLPIVVAACHNAKKTTGDAAKLKGRWELNYISGPRISFNGLYPEKKPEIIFDLSRNKASGSTSCNSFSGTVTIDGNKINFSDAMTLTKMACAGQGETVFLQTLKKITTYDVTSVYTLTLLMDDVAMMRFTRAN